MCVVLYVTLDQIEFALADVVIIITDSSKIR